MHPIGLTLSLAATERGLREVYQSNYGIKPRSSGD
jgi:hypothetical protein